MDNSNRVVVCVRDGSCSSGGGIHCYCCNDNARRRHNRVRPGFASLVRCRLRTFVARDLRRNPY